ncbi:MAG: Flp pilus assembly protein TadD [Pseudohongiellaceae bacterium]|jgi:Flp pilus assembly protein TadD
MKAINIMTNLIGGLLLVLASLPTCCLRVRRLPLKELRFILLLVLTSCSAIDLDTTFTLDQDLQNNIINQYSDQFIEIEPLYLSDEIKTLLDDVIKPYDGEVARVEKIQDILYGQDYLGITYSDQKTHTAVEAFHAREGNCLSVMNLYIAMARYLEVDADFQTVAVQPNWDRRGDLLVLSQHINATGRFNAQKRYVVDFTPEIALQQLTSSIVTDVEARALYFNNLGVEALIKSDYEGALRYLKNSLFLDPKKSIVWNNIGTTYNRLDNSEYAEYAYQQSFDLDNRNATAVNNLAKFYTSRGDLRLARKYEKAIERFNKKNPYYHFAIGRLAYADKNMSQARLSFSRALKLKEEEPEFYMALAQVYLALGDIEEARRYAESAQRLVALNDEIYVPSSQKIRIINSNTILRDSSPGISIVLPR